MPQKVNLEILVTGPGGLKMARVIRQALATNGYKVHQTQHPSDENVMSGAVTFLEVVLGSAAIVKLVGVIPEILQSRRSSVEVEIRLKGQAKSLSIKGDNLTDEGAVRLIEDAKALVPKTST